MKKIIFTTLTALVVTLLIPGYGDANKSVQLLYKITVNSTIYTDFGPGQAESDKTKDPGKVTTAKLMGMNFEWAIKPAKDEEPRWNRLPLTTLLVVDEEKQSTIYELDSSSVIFDDKGNTAMLTARIGCSSDRKAAEGLEGYDEKTGGCTAYHDNDEQHVVFLDVLY